MGVCVVISRTGLWCTHLKTVVGPGAKLHLTALIVEGEPGNVDFARGLEDAGRHVQAAAIVPHNHIGGIGAVKALVRAASKYAMHKSWLRYLNLLHVFMCEWMCVCTVCVRTKTGSCWPR